ncbi:hypothetical protein COCHEDRAFT_1031516 [Bipolaris maydis C5]|uniref:Rhodopsin domain-containing protein n=1 Tax=Cochliobolus heterostrophus (strain C5 / ATCC 48332 / race O) TaxID=701091 RepID=M2UQF6_COCH5|nr:hypothetical protein COCHEDRAFT_1031516 [Bipolaris maydis C5]KAJ5063757.1 hypothetical protein J3E74DRAFT_207025 [Bipolaris maydis]KAJ6197092.1 hypothetical protein J3E72DRAFT_193699 [Bipolaris maydis]KAJ6207990.1 hypothetical protein PSV09DRAFT_1031516 [Bipolaris maydis]KAJ6269389.1 hypothetical protein PSV08DRAFT_352517 [Bipolaris maydis]
MYLQILVTAFQCIPVAALWTPALKSSAKCVELVPFFFGTSVPNILADVFLLALPAPYVWSLKITLTQKTFVMGFFLLGSFVLVASIIRLVDLLHLDMNGFLANWTVSNSVVWSAVENCMGVVCICLPSLRPIIDLLPWASRFGKSLGSNHTNERDVRILRSENRLEKPKHECDEYELLGKDSAGCWVQAERPVEEHSIKTEDGGNITVRTQIQISSGDEMQPVKTVGANAMIEQEC